MKAKCIKLYNKNELVAIVESSRMSNARVIALLKDLFPEIKKPQFIVINK